MSFWFEISCEIWNEFLIWNGEYVEFENWNEFPIWNGEYVEFEPKQSKF